MLRLIVMTTLLFAIYSCAHHESRRHGNCDCPNKKNEKSGEATPKQESSETQDLRQSLDQLSTSLDNFSHSVGSEAKRTASNTKAALHEQTTNLKKSIKEFRDNLGVKTSEVSDEAKKNLSDVLKNMSETLDGLTKDMSHSGEAIDTTN